MREIKSRNAANIIIYISSEMGLSDRTGETGLARFRAPAVGLRDHELRGVRRTPRRAGSASASGVRDATEMTGAVGTAHPALEGGARVGAGLRSSIDWSFDLRRRVPCPGVV